MKYRLIERKVIREWSTADYSACQCYDVQYRFLFFFWVTLKSFWQKEYAEKYLKACLETNTFTTSR